MKEYRCCLEFRRGDNSTDTFTKRGVVYLVSAIPYVKTIPGGMVSSWIRIN
jgi:hypothetical protein